jgi:hypothetical protein
VTDVTRRIAQIEKLGFAAVPSRLGVWAVTIQTVYPQRREVLIALEPSTLDRIFDELSRDDEGDWSDTFVGLVSEGRLEAERSGATVVHIG